MTLVVIDPTYGDVVQTIAVGVGALGFFVAVKQLFVANDQLRRTATQVEAIKKTVERTEGRMAHNELLMQLTALRSLARTIESSVAQNRREEVVTSLAQWHEDASEIRGLINGEEPFRRLSDLLYESITLVIQAKNDTAERDDIPLAEQTKYARNSITSACGELASLTGRLKKTSEDMLR